MEKKVIQTGISQHSKMVGVVMLYLKYKWNRFNGAFNTFVNELFKNIIKIVFQI